MNRSILIIICDFLVLSLLSLARFDVADTTPQSKVPKQELSTNARPTEDVLNSLAAALEQERQAREQLLAQLAEARQNLTRQEQILSQQENVLEDRTERLETFQQDLLRKEEEARRLQADRSKIEEQFAQTQSSVESLKKELVDTSTEARVSQAQLQAIQAELTRRLQEAERMQQKLADVENAQRATENEKHQLSTQLQVTETEKRLARAQIDMMRGEIQIVREEKARLHEHSEKLTEGVSSLAQKSGELAQKSTELTQEIRENRPLAPNTIFSDFVANRVQTDFQASRRGVFGRDVRSDNETKTILVDDGTRVYALLHIADTPLTLSDPGTDWDWVRGNLRRQATVVPIDQLWLLHLDPRVAVVPLTGNQARQLGAKAYKFTHDPFKFQDAVVVGASEGYYGECRFQLDPTLPQYVKMERSTLRGLFGKFNPSRGDLVFSKSGELLGLMVNNDYCALLSNLSRARAIRFGNESVEQRTGVLLAEMRGRVDRLPQPLQ